MNTKLLKFQMLVEIDVLQTLKGFVEKYGQSGNTMVPMAKNDAEQVIVEFGIATPDAAVWLYGWIHKFKFDGDQSKDRDSELEWITGSADFRELIYAILYKGKYEPNGSLNTIKMS